MGPCIDSHCHLPNMADRDPALLEELGAALGSGQLKACIDIGVEPGNLARRLALMAQTGVRHFSLGLYPALSAHADSCSLLDALKAEIAACQKGALPPGLAWPDPVKPPPRLVAVGEIGVDLHWRYAPEGQQIDFLCAQIALANDFDLPVIIHNREADHAISQAIKRCPPRRGGLLHCFSSHHAFAESLIDEGFLISFAGNLSYRNATKLQEAARRLPVECLACETDAPYLSPEPHRGKPNVPTRVALVYECLAALRSMAVEELREQVERNLARVIPW